MNMVNKTPWVVALSGGVAAGKTAVSRRFAVLGISVHDADVAAREVVALGTPGLRAIGEAFGTQVLQDDGSLDRRAMRRQVFADDDARVQLESIVHPRVREWLSARVNADHGPYCMLAIPLLAENWSQYAWVNRVLMVDAPDALRVQRLMRRDDLDRAGAERMLAAQASREQRLALADDVIDNDGDEDALNAIVATLHRRYLKLAARTSQGP